MEPECDDAQWLRTYLYRIPEPRLMRMPGSPLISCPPPPVSAHPPVLVAQPLPQSLRRAARFGGAIYDIPADVLRGAIPPTVPSNAKRCILMPDTTTSTMMGISVDNLPSFPRPDCEPAN